MKNTIQYGFYNALLAACYVSIVATLLTNAQGIVGPENNAATTLAFLLTFVLSAAVMGISIFGRSVLWYLDGRRKEAILLVFSTIGFLLVITVLVFLLLLVFNKHPTG